MNPTRIAQHVAEAFGRADVAVTLGSGLGAFAESLENAQLLSASDIPGYPASNVSGHAGVLYCGNVHNMRVLAFSGRLHIYEGHGFEAAALPAFIAKALGAKLFIAANAAGGVNPRFVPGDFMLINDYFMPPVAIQDFGGFMAETKMERPIARPAPDAAAMEALRNAALSCGIQLHEGTYAYVLGPSYETRAEIAFLRKAGADAVGMSTVPELIAAARLGLPWAGISCITNRAGTHKRTTHEGVKNTAETNGPRLAEVLREGLRITR